ncbi:MAG TPA: hypothetical protein VGP82_23930, partial [Ktedonobacterales bacterium]|nr:hypothetical protein [Ktedonobacterales bacterium]
MDNSQAVGYTPDAAASTYYELYATASAKQTEGGARDVDRPPDSGFARPTGGRRGVKYSALDS